MKLSQLQPNVSKMSVFFPNGEETGIVLHLTGHDTKVFRDKARSFAKGMVGKKANEIDLDKAEEQDAELTAACVVGWEGLEDDEGQPLLYSPEQALKLIKDPGLGFVRQQVERYIADRRNFFRPAGQ